MIPKEEMTKFNEALKEGRLPDTVEMSNRTFAEYQRLHGNLEPEYLKENFSEVITQHVQLETQVFNQIMREIRRNWTSIFMKIKNRETEFPNISQAVNKANDIMEDESLSNEEKLFKVVEELAEINHGISFSHMQAAKSRAGAAFENYLGIFFDILDYKYDPQVLIPSGETLDFVFPNGNYLKTNPQDCILVECQTTLKDRYRLSLGKGQFIPGTTKFIATLTGDNIITSSDHKDLTQPKIDEIRDKQYRLITLKSVAEKLNQPAVISFEDFVQTQYPNRSGLWSIAN